MNYRHGYHAGNFADVLKHTRAVRAAAAADGQGQEAVRARHPCRRRRLRSGRRRWRRARGEAEAGIARLMAAPRAGMPAAVARYLAAVAAYDRKFGPAGGALRRYPGSPRLVRAALRPGDRFVACELHPQEALALKREFAGDRAVEVRQADGYHALKALLPPVERRGLVLIDPPFETADEFERLLRAPCARRCGASRPAATRSGIRSRTRRRRGVRRRAGRPEGADPGAAAGRRSSRASSRPAGWR